MAVPQPQEMGCKLEGAKSMTISVDSTRVVCPLFQTEDGGSIPASTLQLIFEPCPRKYAALLNQQWHSRLPRVEWQNMTFAFHARYGDVSYAVALWSNPVARLLPQKWIELRRMACSPEMPRNGASAFLAWMVRWFRKNHRDRERLISYQDTEVHSGTIYKAQGWVVGNIGRTGDSWKRVNRDRPMLNGVETIASAKIRWEKSL